MYTVYILRSEAFSKYYIRHTENTERRLSEHNSGHNRSTKAFVPWDIVFMQHFDTKQEAYAREMQIKSYKGGRAFKSLIDSHRGGVA